MDIDGSNLKCVTNDLDQIPSSAIWANNSSKVYFNVREYGQSNIYRAD